MNYNVSIVDQMLEGEIARNGSILPYPTDIEKRKSATFILFCMAKRCGKTIEEVLDWFTDGGQDAGVDGLYFEEIYNEIHVTLFQGKYYRSKEGNKNFAENDIQKTINIIRKLFDPDQDLEVNEKFQPKLEEVRSFIRDGHLPVVHVILCNNGMIWNEHAQRLIDAANLPQGQVTWEHFNHDSIISILKTPPKINTNLQLQGKSIYEKFREKDVLLGKVNVLEIARLIESFGDGLLEGNIRRFLGIEANRVNAAINATLKDPIRRDDFYFLNNGITIVCNKMSYNALQQENHLVKLENARIINGGQTSKTIAKTLQNDKNANKNFSTCFVLVRIYEINDSDKNIIHDVTLATNSQNPVDLSDLHSNDDYQKNIELSLKLLGYTYKRHKKEDLTGNNLISPAQVAEATLAIWMHAPHQAKYMRREHFGKLYESIFKELNPAEAVIGVLILRRVENLRKRPVIDNPPKFLPYASHYIAMIMGSDFCKTYDKVTIENFAKCKDYLEENFLKLYLSALNKITLSLEDLYKDVEKLSLQQLAATFRRGDLIKTLLRN